MSLINFGGNTSQQGVFSRIRPYPTPNIQGVVPTGGIPVVRTGNKNYYLFNQTNLNSDAGYRTIVNLYTTNPTALVASFDTTSIVASAKILSVWLSSADQTLYILYKGVDGLVRLAKMNDSTGAVTQIGSGFTPATPANWSFGSGKLEYLSGYLRYTHLGKYHEIDTTTGAPFSEDNVFNLSGFATIGADYVSLDGSIYVSGDINVIQLNSTSSPVGSAAIPTMSASSVGVVSSVYCQTEDIFGVRLGGYATSSQSLPMSSFLIDNDKMVFTTFIVGTGVPMNVVLRNSYDDFIKSVVDWRAGLR